MEEIALTAMNQRRKLEAVLEATNRCLQAEEPRWSVDGTWPQPLVSGAGPEPGSLCVGTASLTHEARLRRLRSGGSERGRSLRPERSGHKVSEEQTALVTPVPEVSLQGSPARGQYTQSWPQGSLC